MCNSRSRHMESSNSFRGPRALRCCNKTWSVASDDFVLTSAVGVIFHTLWFVGLIAFTLVVLVGRDCFPEDPQKKVVFTFIFSQIALQLLVIISEGLVGFMSSRGTISNPRPRRFLPYFLVLRAVLYAVEVLGCAFGCYVTWSPYIQDHIDCERADKVRQAIKAYVISVIVLLVLIAVLFLIYFDPLGLQTPSLLKELCIQLGFSDYNESETNVAKTESHKGAKRSYGMGTKRRWRRRIKILCCCVGSNNSSKARTMEDIAHTLARITHDVEEFVPTHFMAGLMLVHKSQKQQRDHDEAQKKCVWDSKSLQNIRALQDIRHYLKFAFGIYGWPMHVYLNPLVGSLSLCAHAHMKCRAFHKRAKDFDNDSCCLANTTAFHLRSKITIDDIIRASYKNEGQLPYSLCYDHPREAVVLSIRGTMSLRDVLTDLDMAMEDIKLDDEKYSNLETKVHGGMCDVAKQIKEEIDTKIKLKDILEEKDYGFIITGHSLGAGVAAILAVLYRKEIPKLHCYAYSPPGCLFTQPLVEYSKSFITAIVYGNDLVPRLTVRSLLELKHNLIHLTNNCNIPKHAIICPKLFSCCYRQHHDVSDPGLLNNESISCSTEAGTLKPSMDKHQEAEESKQNQTPAFVPGKVMYIKETRKRIHRRFWNIIGEKEVEVVWKPNEDLSHIIVDDGMFDHHMPDAIQEVLEHLYQQRVEGMGLKIATLDDPIKLDTTFHSNASFSEMSKTEENNDTIKITESTTKAVVHASLEDEHETTTAL